MKNKNVLLILFLLYLASSLHAQTQYSVDTNHIRIGEQLTLSVSNTQAYPTLEDLSQNGLKAIEQWMDTAKKIQYTHLTSFEEGNHWLKLGEDSLLITVDDVADVDTNSAEIKDIAGVEKEPIKLIDILRWIWIPIVAALLVWLFIWWSKKRAQKTPEEVRQKTPPIPADQQALKDLESLRVKQLWQHGKVKEYHTELTDIVRLFLENAHGIPSAEMTSDQTMEAYIHVNSHDKDSTKNNIDRLRRILQTADMVKFAKSEPLPYEHDRSLSDAIDFVKEESATINQPTIEKEEKHA